VKFISLDLCIALKMASLLAPNVVLVSGRWHLLFLLTRLFWQHHVRDRVLEVQIF
jgi:hypothetical protein